jgi:putative membrane protein
MAEENKKEDELTDQEQKMEWAEERMEAAEERTEAAEQRTDWAEQRTDWAQHRTVLANERTFSAWLRTGLSAVAGGLAVAELLGGEEDGMVAIVLGVILVAVGGLTISVALWRYSMISDVLEKKGLPVTPKWMAYILAGGLLIAALLVLALIFVQ